MDIWCKHDKAILVGEACTDSCEEYLRQKAKYPERYPPNGLETMLTLSFEPETKCVLEETSEEALARKLGGTVPCRPGPKVGCPGCEWLTTTDTYDPEPQVRKWHQISSDAWHRAWEFYG